jgi:hypothetical protein
LCGYPSITSGEDREAAPLAEVEQEVATAALSAETASVIEWAPSEEDSAAARLFAADFMPRLQNGASKGRFILWLGA